MSSWCGCGLRGRKKARLEAEAAASMIRGSTAPIATPPPPPPPPASLAAAAVVAVPCSGVSSLLPVADKDTDAEDFNSEE
ncbi:hypothetical protein BDBG_04717 [Blastomyces gilchristii SLH14081]|uniref:Uncharacterized protein n=1 Tax=Blastomyces gilchristii (strain SLH14081) TaxID=559298 RepID=A0A179UPN6_BLAGS|nr:uncharacterized protein BDBG_04717 [Blastomyces gilchristii SLH14081]OAT09169.1 hypothetical protein BDBG_04717 [Blastomyces gilchristii SLH14081]